MVIMDQSGKYHHHHCSDINCNVDMESDGIDNFYSEVHATDAGWKKTNHIVFCDQKLDYVWVCPYCAAEFLWEKETVNI